jgi:branched-chain amino acid transport system ATP-binding protein
VAAVLRTERLTKHFGGLAANADVSLEVEEGTLHSIIGPNGAGKTTLFNLLSGLLKPTSGRIFYRGRDITGWPPHRVARLGIGRSFQMTNVFPHLTVYENVRLAVQRRRGRPWSFFSRAELWPEEVSDILARTRLTERAGQPAVSLPHGDKRKLELAILLGQDPDCLLLDEPTSGVSREEVPAVLDVIRTVRGEGDRGGRPRTVLMVEHKLDVVMNISDRVTVLDRGRVLASGTPAEIAADRNVQAAYLGGSYDSRSHDST